MAAAAARKTLRLRASALISPARTPLLPLFAFSLAVRLAIWLLVTRSGTPLFADEPLYAGLAQGWGAIFNALASGRWPDAALLERVYGHGVWPPLHPLLLGLGGLCGGISGARMSMVLLSACATPLLFKLARQCGFSRRVALAAALLHALYPECVAFSHYLWSESSFAFFLLAGLSLSLSAVDAAGRRGVALAAAAGALLGCAALCRATLLPLLLFLPLWWLWERRGVQGSGAGPAAPCQPQKTPRLCASALNLPVPACSGPRTQDAGPSLNPKSQLFHSSLFTLHSFSLPSIAALCAAFALVTAPWLITLRLREGAWKPFSTSGGYNLLLGNHPAIPPGLGSAWGTFIYRGGASDRIAAAVRAEAGATAETSALWVFAQDQTCRAMARTEMRRRPGAAALRALQRGLLLTAPDIFLPRHILNLIYRPMPVAMVALLLAAGFLLWNAVMLGTAAALLMPRKPPRLWLLLAAAAALLLPALATISVSRMRFASTLLLFPVACQGLAALCADAWPPLRRAATIALFAVACVCGIFQLRLSLQHFVVPSTHYAPLIRALARLRLAPPETYDTFLVRRDPHGPARVGVSLEATPGAEFVGQERARRVMLPLLPGRDAMLLLRVRNASELRLGWLDPDGASGETRHAAGDFHCQWQPTGVPGVHAAIRGVNYSKGAAPAWRVGRRPDRPPTP